MYILEKTNVYYKLHQSNIYKINKKCLTCVLSLVTFFAGDMYLCITRVCFVLIVVSSCCVCVCVLNKCVFLKCLRHIFMVSLHLSLCVCTVCFYWQKVWSGGWKRHKGLMEFKEPLLTGHSQWCGGLLTSWCVCVCLGWIDVFSYVL